MMVALAVVLGVACGGLAVAALIAGLRAVRMTGWWLLLDGRVWFTRSDRVPPEAWPHMRLALRRWGMAMGCLLLAGIAGALA